MVKKRRSKKKGTTARRRVHHKKHGILGAIPAGFIEEIGLIAVGAVVSQFGEFEADKHLQNKDPRMIGAAKMAIGAAIVHFSDNDGMKALGKGIVAGGAVDVAMGFGAFKQYGIPAYVAPSALPAGTGVNGIVQGGVGRLGLTQGGVGAYPSSYLGDNGGSVNGGGPIINLNNMPGRGRMPSNMPRVPRSPMIPPRKVPNPTLSGLKEYNYSTFDDGNLNY